MPPFSTLCVCIVLLLKIPFFVNIDQHVSLFRVKKLLKLTLSISKKTTFNPDWRCSESHSNLALWVGDIKGGPNKTHCKVFNLSNIGRQALATHSTKSIKNASRMKAQLKSVPVTSFFQGMFSCNVFTKVHYHVDNQM